MRDKVYVDAVGLVDNKITFADRVVIDLEFFFDILQRKNAGDSVGQTLP